MTITRLFLASVLVALPGIGSAGCLDSITSTSLVTSKVRGLYFNSAAAGGGVHYVILDKATCVAASGTIGLGSDTKGAYYLRVREADKSLISLILASQAQGTTVTFRLMPTTDSYNDIGYVISPAGAESQ